MCIRDRSTWGQITRFCMPQVNLQDFIREAAHLVLQSRLRHLTDNNVKKTFCGFGTNFNSSFELALQKFELLIIEFHANNKDGEKILVETWIFHLHKLPVRASLDPETFSKLCTLLRSLATILRTLPLASSSLKIKESIHFSERSISRPPLANWKPNELFRSNELSIHYNFLKNLRLLDNKPLSDDEARISDHLQSVKWVDKQSPQFPTIPESFSQTNKSPPFKTLNQLKFENKENGGEFYADGLFDAIPSDDLKLAANSIDDLKHKENNCEAECLYAPFADALNETAPSISQTNFLQAKNGYELLDNEDDERISQILGFISNLKQRHESRIAPERQEKKSCVQQELKELDSFCRKHFMQKDASLQMHIFVVYFRGCQVSFSIYPSFVNQDHSRFFTFVHKNS
eukprot:TRINITY_DN9599_c0_g2_i5.p1 TRINITY_DN9599_c0_g2~~TRINITY_DN9599_c0_g2_i5.p1  ORF type:complete len:418 (-),score=54.52 TRINITY_DN9599_c0_g2_i5:175-1383(-)